ncbi:MAG: 16S rRNA (guanine(966)-N(2))-methyltransferase RsmD [Oscillospiraceae bacterium]|nr:16S rRNA (guanine(966)-N(2))-methyltransferase RsmD [Oscillospiraceae bacterium]
MRIISGCRRGHKLFEFEGKDVRPTTDRVKESIFNMIASYIHGARVLDMFAGSGALSFEMLSRGAEYAVLLDKDKQSVELIKKNIKALKFDSLCDVREISCFDYAKNCNEQFDVIFLDPPYNKGCIEPALAAIVHNDLLYEDGIVVLESDNTDFRNETEGLRLVKQKRYGRTFITIYEKSQNEDLR